MSDTNDEIVLKLEVTVAEANTIVAGLGEIPAKFSMPLIQKIQQQAGPQLPVAEQAAPAPAETPAA